MFVTLLRSQKLARTLNPFVQHIRRCSALPPLITTRSGLMYRDVHVPDSDDAAIARSQTTVVVHYTGRLEDGVRNPFTNPPHLTTYRSGARHDMACSINPNAVISRAADSL